VVGINEFYTSKKCPDCEQFMAQVTLLQFFCPHCERYYHRDVMAAENMCRIVQGYLMKQERPLYLQPVTEAGRYPWMAPSAAGDGPSTIVSSCSTTATNSSASTKTSTSNALSRIRKRASSVSNPAAGHPEKRAKEL
jgi:hypothetical protein